MTPTKDPVSPERVAEDLRSSEHRQPINPKATYRTRDIALFEDAANVIDHLRGEVERLTAECALGDMRGSYDALMLQTREQLVELRRSEARCAALVEALETIAGIDEPVRAALLDDVPPARLKLSDGSIVTGEVAEVVEELAKTIIWIAERVQAALKAVTPTTSDGDIGEASGDQVARPQTEAGEPVKPSEGR